MPQHTLQGTPPWETSSPSVEAPASSVPPTDAPHPLDTAASPRPVEPESSPDAASEPENAEWGSFVEFCRKNQQDGLLSLPALTQANGTLTEGVLTLATTSAIQYEQLVASSRLAELERLASEYSGREITVRVSPPKRLHKTEAELKKEFASHPVIKSLAETFDASLLRCIPVEQTRG